MQLVGRMPEGIKKKLHRMVFLPEQTILYAEHENEYVYFLIEGMAQAYVPSSQGVFSSVHIYEAGGFFGEAEQFYEGRKPVEISAMTTCVVDRLHRNDFFDWMKNDFEVTKLIIKEMAYKLILNSEYIEEMSQWTVKERFLRCVAKHQQRGSLAALTKEQMAKEAKAPLRSINRAIAACAKEGVLCYKGKRIYILDEEKMQACLQLKV
ncbi:Crp/Fnr family transcriptional regulator [Ruminococcaceae bacterium OttesenSCG-928-N02]|nr:Crp/Fnr family transcriptional regulator [Ruminococcaceae bacterium OttesenSCG-928-N02]